jgi:PKD repeat protein
VDVDSFPVTADLIDIPTFCLGNSLFLSSGFEEAEEYLWSTAETTPFIQPLESGEYWVEATNANGCVGRDTVQVDIVGVAPDVDFGFSPPCENNPVDFDDETVPEGGTITTWNWTFENTASESSDLENPSILYGPPGAYPVELTVTLDNGCTGTGRDTIFVNPLPLVNFSAPIVCAGNEVFFESLRGVPGGGTIASRAWSFGNGTTDTGTVGSTTFEELGFNTVTHIVTTESQCTDSLTRNVEVLGSPIADFSAEDACLGSPITFTENVDISVSGPVFYNWQFGDGFFSNFPNTSHEYANPGVYEVTLTATGNNLGVNGCTDQITKSVRVYEPPTASLSTSDACIGAFTELVDLTVPQVLEGTDDPIAERQWTITDGPTGSQQGPLGTDSLQLFLPLAPGTFTVQLDLTTASGCEASTEGSLLAQSIPQANFNLELPIASPPFTASPENLSLDGEGFEWLVNGEVVSTEFEPELNFDAAGDYAVWLVATNTLECNDTAKVNYTVVIPEYDLEMISLRYETQGNGIVLKAIINNNGNVRVNTFDTRVEVGRDINLEFESEFAIPAGQLREYTLGTEIGYLPGRDLPYTCMRVSNPNGQQETDTTNNYLCIGLDEQKATFAAPFPNPANDEVNLAFILPEAGQVRVEFVGPDGRMVEDFVLDLEKGLNELAYPLVGWAQGLYFVKLSYRSQEEVHRLVIAR